MANAMYNYGRELFLTAGINWSTADIKVVAIDTGTYTFSAAHQFHSELSGIVATSGNLASKTVTGGIADAADVTLSAVTGSSIEAFVVYKDTGVSGTSPLILYLDSGTGLPVTPNGGDIIIAWANTTNKIFKL